MRKVIAAIVILVLVLAAYLLFMPVPIEPVAWNPPKNAGYAGPHAVNNRLANLRQIPIGNESGPEHVVLGPAQKLYAAVDGGKIMRMNPDGSGVEVWARTGGRVLGFDFDGRGRLIAADAEKGLLAIEAGQGTATERKVTVLANRVRMNGGDDPIRYADAVVVAKEGKIYLSDASRRFGPAQYGGTFNASLHDLMENSATGRILVHDPVNSKTEVMVNGLSFANGVALSADEQSIFVVETGKYRIWKFAVGTRGLNVRDIDQENASKSGQARVVLANLPGYPDNLMRGMKGRIWAGLIKPRSTTVDGMAGRPFLRKVSIRLPKMFWPVPPAYGHVFAFDEEGRVVVDMQDPSGQYPDTTGVTETADRLYIQSLHAPALGWMPKVGSGL